MTSELKPLPLEKGLQIMKYMTTRNELIESGLSKKEIIKTLEETDFGKSAFGKFVKEDIKYQLKFRKK